MHQMMNDYSQKICLNINYFSLYFPGAGLYYIYNSKKATETKLRSCREANIPPGEGGAWRGS